VRNHMQDDSVRGTFTVTRGVLRSPCSPPSCARPPPLVAPIALPSSLENAPAQVLGVLLRDNVPSRPSDPLTNRSTLVPAKAIRGNRFEPTVREARRLHF